MLTAIPTLLSPLFILDNSNRSISYILLAGGLTCLFLAIWLIQSFRQKRKDIREAQEKKQDMLNILQEAIDNASLFELIESEQIYNSEHLISSECLKATSSGIILELKTPTELKPDQNVKVFFRIEKNKNINFYSFQATVLRKATKNGRQILELNLPTKFGNEQKRLFFRLKPGLNFVAALAMWNIKPDQFPGSAKELGKPLFIFRENKLSHIIVEDISAGGLRLHLDGKHRKSLEIEYKLSDYVMVLMVLRNEISGELKHYWMLCSCRFAAINHENQGQTLGVQFLAWATTKTINDSLYWQKTGRQGEVQPLLENLLEEAKLMQKRGAKI